MTEKLPAKRVETSYYRFKKALDTLDYVVNYQGSNELLQDATVQRFEYTYEATWKLIKFILEDKGVYCNFPSDIFKEAFSAGWITDAEIGKEMIECRNSTSHIYNETNAYKVFNQIREQFYPELRTLQIQLEKEIWK